jgi:nitroimidazol reductase NimA-like FMN-containing flavoprotein (pyridoxamine 5'-phosphate oxidase superfamily)
MTSENEHFPLDEEDRATLLREAPQCTFIWSTREGWPVGVTMSYLWEHDRFWLITSPEQARVAAVRRDPRVSVAISMGPRTATAKGRCRLPEDDETRRWAFSAFSARQARLFPDLIDAGAFAARMLRLERCVLEITPETWITYDGTRAALT